MWISRRDFWEKMRQDEERRNRLIFTDPAALLAMFSNLLVLKSLCGSSDHTRSPIDQVLALNAGYDRDPGVDPFPQTSSSLHRARLGRFSGNIKPNIIHVGDDMKELLWTIQRG